MFRLLSASGRQSLARDTLAEARQVITPPGRWVKGAFCQPGPGFGRSNDAFCAVGAIQFASRPHRHPIRFLVRTHAFSALGGNLHSLRWVSEPRSAIMYFNDSYASHETVLQAFDSAVDTLTQALTLPEPPAAETAVQSVAHVSEHELTVAGD